MGQIKVNPANSALLSRCGRKRAISHYNWIEPVSLGPEVAFCVWCRQKRSPMSQSASNAWRQRSGKSNDVVIESGEVWHPLIFKFLGLCRLRRHYQNWSSERWLVDTAHAYLNGYLQRMPTVCCLQAIAHIAITAVYIWSWVCCLRRLNFI